MRMYLLDKKQRVKRWLKDNDFLEAEMTEEINAANQINFSTPLKDRIADNIYYVAIPTPRSKQKYLLFKLLSERVKNDRIEYQGIEEAYDELKQYGYIKDIRPNDRTAEEMLKMVLEPTRWTLGNVPETNHQSTNFYYITYLEALQKIVGLFNIELTFEVTIDPKSNKITRRQVNVYTEQGQRTGKRFEYGSNLLTVQQEQDSQELITALVGRGKGELVSEGYDDTPDGYGRRITFADVVWTKKDGHPVDKPAGQEYLVDPEATALYGFSDGNPRIGLTVFEDIEDPVELINATWRALQSLKRPKVSFKADVTDVGQLGLGDTVAIIRHDLKIEYFTRVYKVKHNLLNENDNQIELGDDFSGHSITSSLIKVDEIANEARETAGHAAIAANGKNNNYYSSVQPLAPVEGDIWYKDLGNGETDMYQYHNGGWVFIQSTRDLHVVENQVKEAQQGLNQAKADIINNKQKADTDIENLNKSIKDNKKFADESLKKLNDSVTNLQGQYDNNVVPNLNKVMADASDALQKYITAQNSIADLTKQAQKQGKDIADVTNTVKGLDINYANLVGDVNSTKVDVKGLQTTVGTANGDIAQLKLDAQNLQTMLAGKVDNSTYTNFVNLTNQALNARLTASDLNGYAKTVDVQATANGLKFNIDSVTDRMNNLNIGGRNLLRDSDKEYVMGFGVPNTKWENGYASTPLPTTGNGNEILPQFDGIWYLLTPGQQYTQTIWFKTDANTKDLNAAHISWFSIQSGAGKHNYQGAKIQKLGENSYKLFSTYQWPEGKTSNSVRLFDIDNLKSAIDLQSGTYLKFGKLKLEVGAESTDWQPAPEDTEKIISELSARITTTSQQFSSYYTKSETDNRTNSAKSDAVNAIKSDSNWQGLSNILTNSGFLQTADGFLQKVQQTTVPMFSGGGVNLLQGTKDFSGSWRNWSNDQTWKHDGWVDPNGNQAVVQEKRAWNGYYQPKWLDAGTYTFSCYYYITGADTKAFIYSNPNGGDNLVTLNTGSKELNSTKNRWNKAEFTFAVTKAGNSALRVELDNYNSGLHIGSYKLEKGSVATPWTPNPNDLATQSAFSELSQSLEGLRSTVGSNYGNLQSQISQSSSTVRTDLTNKINGIQNQVTTTADGLNAKIGAIQIGGRNYLRNSDKSITGWAQDLGTIPNEVLNELAGKTITVSCDVEWSGYAHDNSKQNRLGFEASVTGSDGHSYWLGAWKNPTILSGKERISTQYTLPAGVTFTVNNNGQNGYVSINGSGKVSHVKIEIGNKATDWAPAPEDTEQAFAEVNATINGLKSTVSGNYGTLTNQITQTTRDEITNKISGLQTQLTQQANSFNVSLNSLRKETVWQKVTSAIDANNYRTTGNYWVQSTPNANTPDSSAWAYLQVVAYPDVKRVKQTWQRDNDENQAYTRLLVGDRWTAWQKTVTAGNIMAQINMSAGTTLIQNDKIYMDASSTVFSGNAFIPSAAITSLNADKITAGTINGAKVNVINLNANNITTGTINGQKLKIDLNTGNVEFQHGRIHNFSNTVDINLDQNYISTANYTTRALLKDGELQLTQPNLFDTNGNWYFRLFNGGGAGDAWAGASLIGRDSVIVANEANAQGATGFTSSPMGTATFSGLFTGKGTNNWMPTILGGAERGVFIKGGNQMSIKQNVMDPNDGGVFVTGSPFISVGVDGPNNNWWGNRIVIDGEYLHVPTAWRHTTGGAPNLVVASDGALVRSTSASKYKTEIHRDYSTNFGDRLLELPTATWIDKGQKERYQEGKRHIKPNKYFGMIAEDLADAGLDLFVSRNPQTHEIEGIQYERIAPALIPVIRKLKKKVQELEEKLNEQ